MIKLKFSLLALIVSLFTSLNAQELLKVTYAHQMSMDDDYMIDNFMVGESTSTPEIKKAFKEALEEVHYYELISSATESVFKEIEKVNNDLPSENSISISFSSGSGNLYKDLNKNESISEIVSLNKRYLIQKNLDDFSWEITRDKSNILGYEVRKATYSDNDKKITAWYAPKLAIKSGPDEYGGLPGLILKIEVENFNKQESNFYFVAENIEVVDDKNLIKKPEGKLITVEEFKKINDEQLRKIKEMYSQGVDTD